MAEISKLGRYELRRILGKGAMGVVYEGYDPTLSRRVAVKTILKSVALDDETDRSYAERFVREAKAVARLNHPNIIQVFDFGVENEVAYLVMEFIQGRELRDFFITGESFDAGESIRIMGELLDALEFAHETGVIHRDVKPANVMLDGKRRVKLADFGVARVQDSDRSAAGTMVGTPAFMSPEQISGGKVDRRTDIFSAGTILYQLLTGEQPFKGEGAWTVAKQIMQDDPPAPSSVVKSVSPVFDAIVEKALAKKVSDRYASAREFATSLRGALSAPAGPTVPATAQKPKAMPQASETEIEFWRSIQNRDDLEELELFLEQFPEGAYAQLARLKLGKLRAPIEAARAAEEKARQESEEQARREVEARVKREAEDKAQREAQEHARLAATERARQEAEARARHEAEERARREAAERVQRLAEEKARHETAEKAKREAAEKMKRAADEKARQAAALARLKQPEAPARARAAVDEDVTVAIGSGRAPTPPAAERKSSYAIPVVAAAIVIAGAVGAYLVLGRKPAPAPVVEAPALAPAPAPVSPKVEVSAADIEKIKKEAEERIRREYADKSAAEQATAAKAASEKAIQEKQLALKAAAEKAAAEKAQAEKLSAAKSASERAALEKAVAERANAEKAAADRAALDRAAAEKVAAEKAAAERIVAEKATAQKQSLVAVSQEALIERFIQRVGRDKVVNKEPPLAIYFGGGVEGLEQGQVLYVNDGSCGPGRIKEITGGNTSSGSNIRSSSYPRRCIPLDAGDAVTGKPSAAKPAAVPPAAAPSPKAEVDAQLERFIQRKGRDKVLKQDPQLPGYGIESGLAPGEVAYVNDGSCPPGRIKEVVGASTSYGSDLRGRPSRCISLAD